MSEKKMAVAGREAVPDSFALLRQFSRDFERLFEPFGAFRWPSLPAFTLPDKLGWSPQVDVFERDNKLVTKIDLPGLKKEDVKVEIAEGYLAISGERKSESEEKTDNIYRRERSYGSFYRAVPLPEGVKVEEVKASFSEGVLEVSVPIPVQAAANARTVTIDEPTQSKAA